MRVSVIALLPTSCPSLGLSSSTDRCWRSRRSSRRRGGGARGGGCEGILQSVPSFTGSLVPAPHVRGGRQWELALWCSPDLLISLLCFHPMEKQTHLWEGRARANAVDNVCMMHEAPAGGRRERKPRVNCEWECSSRRSSNRNDCALQSADILCVFHPHRVLHAEVPFCFRLISIAPPPGYCLINCEPDGHWHFLAAFLLLDAAEFYTLASLILGCNLSEYYSWFFFFHLPVADIAWYDSANKFNMKIVLFLSIVSNIAHVNTILWNQDHSEKKNTHYKQNENMFFGVYNFFVCFWKRCSLCYSHREKRQIFCGIFWQRLKL